jgi:hypothetical protein
MEAGCPQRKSESVPFADAGWDGVNLRRLEQDGFLRRQAHFEVRRVT